MNPCVPCGAEIARDSPWWVRITAFGAAGQIFRRGPWHQKRLVLVALGLVGCAKPDFEALCLNLQRPIGAEGPVVAQVGATSITSGMVPSLALHEGEGLVLGRAVEAVEDRMRFELLAQAAWRENFGSHPDVIETARKVMVRRFLQAKVPLLPADANSVNGNALLRAYETNRHLYLKPEMRRLDLVSLPAGEPSRRLATRLLANLSQGLEPEEALRAASRATRDASLGHPAKGPRRYRGPEPRWVATPFRTQSELTGKVGQEAAAQIFGLEPGCWVQKPIVTPRGFWVVRVAARRADLARSLEQVRPELLAQLTREWRSKTFAELMDSLQNTTPVALYKERIAGVLSLRADTPLNPSLPSAPDAPEVSKTGEMTPPLVQTEGEPP